MKSSFSGKLILAWAAIAALTLGAIEYAVTHAESTGAAFTTLRSQHEALRSEAILSSMVEGVLAVDRDLRVVFCNRAVTQSLGLRAPVRDRAPVIEMIRDQEVIEMLADVVRSSESIKRNLHIAAFGDRTFEVQAAPLGSGGGALAIFHDMTDLERLEQVRKDFVANVSHEIRTPLAAIVGYA